MFNSLSDSYSPLIIYVDGGNYNEVKGQDFCPKERNIIYIFKACEFIAGPIKKCISSCENKEMGTDSCNKLIINTYIK